MGMISEKDRSAIVELAGRYGAHRVLAFGSSADSSIEGRDIDVAVEGVPQSKFFSFFGDLIFGVSKPVDLIDLSSDSAFTRMVRREGITLYDRTR